VSAFIKRDILSELKERIELDSIEQTTLYFDSILNLITETLEKDEAVKITKFGQWLVKHKKERYTTLRNVETHIPANKVITFHTSNVLKEKMNQSLSESDEA